MAAFCVAGSLGEKESIHFTTSVRLKDLMTRLIKKQIQKNINISTDVSYNIYIYLQYIYIYTFFYSIYTHVYIYK